MSCIFCDIQTTHKILFENDLAVAFFDSFPVSDGHTLIVPKRHVKTFFDLSEDEISKMKLLADKVKEMLDEKFQPDGYNIGFNVGEYGGQTVMHCHMHIIPRYKGDIDNPRGGIRKIIKKPKTDY